MAKSEALDQSPRSEKMDPRNVRQEPVGNQESPAPDREPHPGNPHGENFDRWE